MNKKRILRGILALVFLAFTAVMLWGAVGVWSERRQLDRDRELQQALAAGGEGPAETEPAETAPPLSTGTPEETVEPELTRFDAVQSRCEPFAGWLALPGEDGLSRTVVQGEDNEFYLSHNYLGEESVAGELFLDAGCDPDASRNRIVYGHRMKHGRMFSALVAYTDEAYTKEHPDFYYSDGEREYRCTIFAVRRLKPTDPALFQTDFSSEEDFLAYTAEARNEALYPLDVAMEEGAQTIVLYTCDYTFQDARLLVHAVMEPVEAGDVWLEQFALPEG